MTVGHGIHSFKIRTQPSALFNKSITGSCGFTIFKVCAADHPDSVENSESNTTAEMWLLTHTAMACSGVDAEITL
jgi:hypothetical protein